MRFLTILFTFSLALTLAHTAKGQGFSVSPSRIFFSGNPGETTSQTINFSNTSGAPISFTTKIQDWNRDSVGVKIYYEAGTLPLSNAKWLSVASNSIVIKPGEIKKVVVSMQIPKDANQLTHSMIFFTQVKEQQAQNTTGTGIGVNLLLEVGVQAYYVPKGLNAGDIEFISFDDRGAYDDGKIKSRRMALKIHNNGHLNKDAFIKVELTNKETGEEIKIDPKSIAMLPGATQTVLLDLPANLKGKFLVVALIDAGSVYDLKVAEKEILYRP